MLDIEQVSVTPELAKEWLGFAITNRSIRPIVVRAYAADMADDKWIDTGEPVRFLANGRLFDGFHRLSAIILSGVTITMVVMRGFTEDAVWYTDIGVPRKYSDVLRMRGVEYPAAVAAATRRMLAWDKGFYYLTGWAQLGHRPTHAELDGYREGEPKMDEAAKLGSAWYRGARVTPTVMSTCWLILSRIDADAARTFLSRLAAGTELRDDDPVYVLRERLIADREGTSQSTHSSHMNYEEVQRAQVFIAWRAWRAGKTLRSILLPRGGLSNENYPLPK